LPNTLRAMPSCMVTGIEIEGTSVECVVTHAVLKKWGRVLRGLEQSKMTHIAATIATAHLRRSIARRGERWRVEIHSDGVACRRLT
jgi:hypothetical protein